MKNDLWYLGNGRWAAYCEDQDLIHEFKNVKEMQVSATYYHYRKGGIRAVQFHFHQGENLSRGLCLLSYVCSRFQFDFEGVLTLFRRNDSTPYSQKYPLGAFQTELFPPGKTCKANKKSKKNKAT